jgi:N-formylglutamate amidohydrolase
MNKKLILNIPHSSIYFPSFEGYVVNNSVLNNEVLKLTDWYTDDLFYSEDDLIIRADYTRIFCDVERFTDDTFEIMSKYGMGVLYEQSDDGLEIRKVTQQFKKWVLDNFYQLHHEKLNMAVNEQLKLYNNAIIIDCHSYPSNPLKRDLNQNPNRPDFNIGTDPFHTPTLLIDIAVDYFEKSGFSLGIDWPYQGSMVPSEHYLKNKNVQSMMLEINRALYLNEPGNLKSERYNEIKNVIHGFLQSIKKICL